MDKTTINLLTILIAGAGLFAVLVKFYSPEVNYSFYGENPFLIKRDIVENKMSWIFTLLALSGLFLQAYKEIWGVNIKEIAHSINFYLIFFCLGLIGMMFIIFILTGVGNKIAKQKWLPLIVENQREVYDAAKFIIEHDGWRKDQLQEKEKIDDPQKYTSINYKTAEKNISQIEKLLDIKKKYSTQKKRIQNLKKYFSS